MHFEKGEAAHLPLEGRIKTRPSAVIVPVRTELRSLT
jgi:hypothetical protein